MISAMSEVHNERGLRIVAGWLEPVRHLPSPNCDRRPPRTAIDLLVIHNISLPPGCFGGGFVEALFTNCLEPTADPAFPALCGLQVSAHLFIDRRGTLTQFVPFDQRAWHAGVSSHEGRSCCNDFSIGIELEGCDDLPYEAVQYEKLAGVVQLLMRHYPAITPQRIVGHCHIAPQRKTDPGEAFQWPRLWQLLQLLPPG